MTTDTTKANLNNDYTASRIQVLEGLEAVRKRPGMYIGPTDINGLHHMIREVVDNSVDEALAGYADRIDIVLHPDSSVTVADNGRGIPVDLHPVKKVSGLELAATVLHAGGKFDSNSYKVSSGLHGVGLSVVNALSTWMRIDVRTGGKLHMQEYRAGKPLGPVKPIGAAEGSGTSVNFLPDVTIFKDGLDYNFRALVQRFREMAYLTKGLRFHIADERDGNEVNFYFEGGIRSYVRHLNKEKNVLHKTPFYVEREVNGVAVEVALQYTEAYDTDSIYTFANNINNTDGGAHLTGFRNALTRVVNNYARSKNLLKENEANLTGDDVREGLTAVISVKLQDPQFSSQTKEKLVSPEATSAVSSVFGDAFNTWLEENPGDAKRIIEKTISAARTRLAVQKVRETARKSAMEGFSLPGKLADCSDTNPARCEIYIVEGDSAGGCFAGDTKVALADGRALSFEQLVAEQAAGIEHFGYTIRHDGTIGIERIINARITKQNAEVVRVTLDNGEALVCTPDHRFMLRDGSYKPAAELTSADSLMPLYRKQSDKRAPGITIDGYEMAWDPRSEAWLFTHQLADWYNRWHGVYAESDGDHCHHIDFNKHNNNPTNLRRMPADAHLALHREHASRTLHRPDSIEKCRAAKQSDTFRSAMSERMRQPATRQLLSEQATAQWNSAEYKAFMGERWRAFYASSAEYRQQNAAQLGQAQRAYWAEEANRQVQAERVRAHFANNPQAREALAQQAEAQWQNAELREWRREQTREQWTPEFRAQRRAALAQTYYRKTLAALKSCEQQGRIDLDAYQAHRRETNDKSLLRFDTFCERYFGGDASLARDAVANYNHKIVSVECLNERIDVYDIEVPHTHNFALASGVFVHNSAKQGRDRRFQAILPLRGKILNVEKSRLDKMLSNNEVKTLITAIGASVGEQFDPAKLRYHRIVIMTDADVDGSHIRTLLLTFFFRYMRPIITNGHLYIAQPPLFSIKHGKEMKYVYSDNERDAYLNSLPKETREKVHIQRYKGLGEMNAEQLWETTMNPLNRTMGQVTLEDAQQADETFTMLMGDMVPPRKRFIQTHALEVRNLDI
ncbi:MAG TPA: DNA topoisomerase (ATP-hydrolyzing) subunit B [Kouleothrix sp.]|mgnify:CR=1 FL=1|uniref:DNA topoisomerase (ATP-hydrolyzing) subunit B n=1 Tax=Kouleothrix sp. TaxID=2779161 RepID=UPI002C468AF7|nr:DNA topoisomerase (ATP-hydrolyzing) subunit B [Kouleothrix sp.]HRC74860.1 DNA topoisomerase (ATP-hydrolyzing) subunit B [Kouleothrix sp.]